MQPLMTSTLVLYDHYNANMTTTIAARTRSAVLASDCLIPGHFVFAAGHHAVQKLELDNLWDHPHELDTILALLAEAPGLPPADAILGVPTGGQRLAEALVTRHYLDLPFIRLERVPSGAKQDFRFSSAVDEQIAKHALNPRIYEDVVTTLSSIAGVAKLLEPDRQAINALAIWRRGQVQPRYQVGITHHYLVEKLIPNYNPNGCPDPRCQANLIAHQQP